MCFFLTGIEVHICSQGWTYSISSSISLYQDKSHAEILNDLIKGMLGAKGKRNRKKEIGVNSAIAEGRQWHRRSKIDEWEAMQDIIVSKAFGKKKRLWMQVQTEAFPIETQVCPRKSEALHWGKGANYIGDEHNVYITWSWESRQWV